MQGEQKGLRMLVVFCIQYFPNYHVKYTNCISADPHPPNECPEYDTIQSNGEVQVMLGLWGTWSTHSLPLLPGPLWPRMVAPDRVLSMG